MVKEEIFLAAVYLQKKQHMKESLFQHKISSELVAGREKML